MEDVTGGRQGRRMGLAGDASRSLAGLINPSPGIALAATTRRYYLYIHEICLHPTDHPVAENTRHGAFFLAVYRSNKALASIVRSLRVTLTR